MSSVTPSPWETVATVLHVFQLSPEEREAYLDTLHPIALARLTEALEYVLDESKRRRATTLTP